MLIEKFSVQAQAALELAGRIAVKSRHRHLTPAHVLFAMLDSKGAGVDRQLKVAGGDIERLRGAVEARLRHVPKAAAGAEDTPINRSLEVVIIHAEEAASRLGNKYIGPNHLLLGMLDDEET